MIVTDSDFFLASDSEDIKHLSLVYDAIFPL